MNDPIKSIEQKKTKWEVSIPWVTTLASMVVLFVIGYFLVSNIEWFKSSVFDGKVPQRDTPEYRFYAYHLHLSMIKRSVGLFSGFAIMFLGMSGVYFTIGDKIQGEVKAPTLSASIATASPGIIAILVGGYLIISSIQSKDEFPSYRQSNETSEPYIPVKP